MSSNHPLRLLLAATILVGVGFEATAQSFDQQRGVFSFADAVEPSLQAVVQVLNFGAESSDQPESTGSGAVIDAAEGYVVTNHHVVEDGARFKIVLRDGRTVDARLVGSDPATDLALLKVVAPPRLAAVAVGDSSALRVGDVAIAVGYPFGLAQTVTSGIISGLGRTGIGADVEDFIQTDAAINSGNSGGPLLDSRGRLVGVNTAIYSRGGGGNVGIGFAVPSRIVLAVVEQLKTGQGVRRGVIGVGIEPAGPQGSGAQGARVASVESGSPAAASGLRVGDVVVSADGQSVRGPNDLRRAVALTPPGKTLAVEVMRGEQRLQLSLTVRAPVITTASSSGAAALGAQFSEITRGHPLAGLVSGVVIQALAPNSVLAQRGLQVGDIITQVNQMSVSSVAEFEVALSRYPGRKTLLIARGNALAPVTID